MAGRPERSPSAVPRLVLLGAIWGATFPISRLGVDTGADPFLLVTLDLALAAAVMAVVATVLKGPRPAGRSLVESAGLGALLIGGINLPLFWGERYATGGAASVVYAASPMVSLGVVALLGAGGRFGPRRVLALVLGLAGVLVLALASGGAVITSAWGLAAFGLGAACQGTGAVALGRRRPRGEGLWGETFQFVGGEAIALVALVAFAPRLTITWGAPVVCSVLFVGLVSMALGYAVFFDLIQRHGAVEANQVTYLNPVVALALGVLAFGEPFAPEEGGGLALILIALALLHAPSGRTGGTGAPSEAVPLSPSGDPRAPT